MIFIELYPLKVDLRVFYHNPVVSLHIQKHNSVIQKARKPQFYPSIKTIVRVIKSEKLKLYSRSTQVLKWVYYSICRI